MNHILPIFFLLLTFLSPTVSAQTQDDAFLKARNELLQCIHAYDKLKDYTTTLYKRERKDGKRLKDEVFFMKFRKPFSVYIKSLEGPNKGRGMLYIEGRWRNRILVHQAGTWNVFLPSFFVSVDSPFATWNNRHLLTDVGIGYLINSMRSEFFTAADRGELSVKYYGRKKEGQEEGDFFEFRYDTSGGRDYYCPRGEIGFSTVTHLPVHIWIYEGPNANQLVEEYRYKNTKADVGLTDLDFDPVNKEYGFGTVWGGYK